MYQNRFRTPPAGEAYDASLDSLIGRRGRDSPISLPFDTFSVSRGGPSPRRAGPRPQRVLRRLCNDLVRMATASLGDLTPCNLTPPSCLSFLAHMQAQCTSVESAVWTRRSAVSTAVWAGRGHCIVPDLSVCMACLAYISHLCFQRACSICPLPVLVHKDFAALHRQFSRCSAAKP